MQAFHLQCMRWIWVLLLPLKSSPTVQRVERNGGNPAQHNLIFGKLRLFVCGFIDIGFIFLISSEDRMENEKKMEKNNVHDVNLRCHH